VNAEACGKASPAGIWILELSRHSLPTRTAVGFEHAALRKIHRPEHFVIPEDVATRTFFLAHEQFNQAQRLRCLGIKACGNFDSASLLEIAENTLRENCIMRAVHHERMVFRLAQIPERNRQ
jgi:hypothetical protein